MPGIKIDRGLPSRLPDVPEAARALERQGYDGAWSAEVNHNRTGRERRDFRLACPVFVVTGETDEQLQAADRTTRQQIAFYGSTPAYQKVLELHGCGDLHTELHRLSLQGEWQTMGTLTDEEILQAFAVVAGPEELAAKFRARCDGVIDRVLPAFSGVDEEVVTAVLNALRGNGS
jgi:alkanesulfonate monooxygenase SsuD/methylene tetrahydromethanopterin reductase-like flavin-dependent oxidoreductase (luciferase family)